MKKIIIYSKAHGRNEVLVDDEDFEFLNQFTWGIQKSGNKLYAARKYPRTKSILMHRVLLKLEDSKIYGDHIDGNSLSCLGFIA